MYREIPPILGTVKIPSKIHFIWVGGPIYPQYLETIMQLAGLVKKSPGFELHLWVDHEQNYYKTLYEKYPFLGASHSSMRLRNIEELKKRMFGTGAVKDEFYQESSKAISLWKNVYREMIGAKNLAAASDILRYEILRQEGGVYFDTDTKFHFTQLLMESDGILKEQYSYFGFKFNGVDVEIKKRSYTIGHVSIPTKSNSRFQINLDDIEAQNCNQCDINLEGINNDIIMSVPHHEILEEILNKVLECYSKLDASSNYVGSTVGQVDMDLKRSPRGFMRRALTINSTGPGVLHQILLDYWERTGENNYDKAYDFVSMDRTAFGLEFTGASDQTWLNCHNIKSYDDNELFRIRQSSTFF